MCNCLCMIVLSYYQLYINDYLNILSFIIIANNTISTYHYIYQKSVLFHIFISKYVYMIIFKYNITLIVFIQKNKI